MTAARAASSGRSQCARPRGHPANSPASRVLRAFRAWSGSDYSSGLDVLPAIDAFAAPARARQVGSAHGLHLREHASKVAGIGHSRAIAFRVAIACRNATSPVAVATASFPSAPGGDSWSGCPGGTRRGRYVTPGTSRFGQHLQRLVAARFSSTCWPCVALDLLLLVDGFRIPDVGGPRLSCFVILAQRLGDGPGGELPAQVGDGVSPKASGEHARPATMADHKAGHPPGLRGCRRVRKLDRDQYLPLSPPVS